MTLTDEALELLATLTKTPQQMQDLLYLYHKNEIKSPYWQGVINTIMALNKKITENEIIL